jgi:hypothetical protein
MEMDRRAGNRYGRMSRLEMAELLIRIISKFLSGVLQCSVGIVTSDALGVGGPRP